MVAVIASGRWPSGANSATSAAALGMAPPRPMPATNLARVNIGMVLTNAAARVGTAKRMTMPSSAVLRPMRSLSMPPTTPPSIMPNGAAADAVANAARGRFHSRVIDG